MVKREIPRYKYTYWRVVVFLMSSLDNIISELRVSYKTRLRIWCWDWYICKVTFSYLNSCYSLLYFLKDCIITPGNTGNYCEEKLVIWLLTSVYLHCIIQWVFLFVKEGGNISKLLLVIILLIFWLLEIRSDVLK